MAFGTQPTGKALVQPVVEKQQNIYSDELIKEWLYENELAEDKFVCLIMGSDGSGKSPLALSYLTDEDIKAGKRVIVIDLDGGNIPLINKYHKQRCQNLGRDAQDVFLVKNPQKEILTDDGVEIDYKATFDRIKGVCRVLKNDNFIKDNNIKYVIFDGLSTLLMHAENQMRVEKNIDATGGVNLKFWMIRNKLFKEVLDSIKSLPISSFFIAHEDFILKKGEENSSIKEKTNSMMHQKIKCEKVISKDTTTFKATILKSKYNIKQEGKEIIFSTVNRNDNGDIHVKWFPEKVLKELI